MTSGVKGRETKNIHGSFPPNLRRDTSSIRFLAWRARNDLSNGSFLFFASSTSSQLCSTGVPRLLNFPNNRVTDLLARRRSNTKFFQLSFRGSSINPFLDIIDKRRSISNYLDENSYVYPFVMKLRRSKKGDRKRENAQEDTFPSFLFVSHFRKYHASQILLFLRSLIIQFADREDELERWTRVPF